MTGCELKFLSQSCKPKLKLDYFSEDGKLLLMQFFPLFTGRQSSFQFWIFFVEWENFPLFLYQKLKFWHSMLTKT